MKDSEIRRPGWGHPIMFPLYAVFAIVFAVFVGFWAWLL